MQYSHVSVLCSRCLYLYLRLGKFNKEGEMNIIFYHSVWADRSHDGRFSAYFSVSRAFKHVFKFSFAACRHQNLRQPFSHTSRWSHKRGHCRHARRTVHNYNLSLISGVQYGPGVEDWPTLITNNIKSCVNLLRRHRIKYDLKILNINYIHVRFFPFEL